MIINNYLRLIFFNPLIYFNNMKYYIYLFICIFESKYDKDFNVPYKVSKVFFLLLCFYAFAAVFKKENTFPTP